jgi:Glycosyltransferase family 87
VATRAAPWTAPWSVRRVWTAWAVGRTLVLALVLAGRVLGAQQGVLGDVRIYAVWGARLAHGGGLPVHDDRWQYPPGAAVLLVIPGVLRRLSYLPYPAGFLLLLLAVDAALTAALLRSSTRAARIWVVGVCALGPVALARFDMVPAAFAVAALLALAGGRFERAGAGICAGALLKVWPALLLAGLPFRPVRGWLRLAAGMAAAAGGMALVFLATGWWRDAFGFVGAQEARGLQVEAVPATPFLVARMLGVGDAPAYSYGSLQFSTPAARTVATVCSLVEMVLVVGATLWWWSRARRTPQTGAALAERTADRAFALLLIVLLSSRVLSPQYLVWLIGLVAARAAVAEVAARAADGVAGMGVAGGSPAGPADPDDPVRWADAGPDPEHLAAGPALWRRMTGVLLVASLMSQVIYPLRYNDVIDGRIVAGSLLVLRNLLLITITVYAIRLAAARSPSERLPKVLPRRRRAPQAPPAQPVRSGAR